MSPAQTLFAPEYDAGVYRRANPDLADLIDGALSSHFNAYGREEGRKASLIANRSDFLAAIPMKNVKALELGPFCNPFLHGPQVSYFDVLDQDQLKQRASLIGLLPEGCPKIDFVSPEGRLDIVDSTFDIVFSSHTVEHQPDLIVHLRDVERITIEDGIYALIVPDKRYCFDHFLPCSLPSEIVAAYQERRRFHTLKNFLDHRLLLTHNDPVRHWIGDHGKLDPEEFHRKLTPAMEEWRLKTNTYIDVHAWQFTPSSFASTIELLYETNIINFYIERVYHTQRNTLEFFVVLRKRCQSYSF